MIAIVTTKAKPYKLLSKIPNPLKHLSCQNQDLLLFASTNKNNTNNNLTSIRTFASPKQNDEEMNVKGDRLTNILIQVIDSKPRPAPKLSKEEVERRHNIGRNYVIGNFKKHNEINHDLACKIKMKNHAIAMLPKKSDKKYGYLRDSALSVSIDDEFMPPFERPIAVDTPPIKDFDPSVFINEEE